MNKKTEAQLLRFTALVMVWLVISLSIPYNSQFNTGTGTAMAQASPSVDIVTPADEAILPTNTPSINLKVNIQNIPSGATCRVLVTRGGIASGTPSTDTSVPCSNLNSQGWIVLVGANNPCSGSGECMIAVILNSADVDTADRVIVTFSNNLCGAANQACCEQTYGQIGPAFHACSDSLSCNSGICRSGTGSTSCGATGQACCTGACNTGLACNNNLCGSGTTGTTGTNPTNDNGCVSPSQCETITGVETGGYFTRWLCSGPLDRQCKATDVTVTNCNSCIGSGGRKWCYSASLGEAYCSTNSGQGDQSCLTPEYTPVTDSGQCSTAPANLGGSVSAQASQQCSQACKQNNYPDGACTIQYSGTYELSQVSCPSGTHCGCVLPDSQQCSSLQAGNEECIPSLQQSTCTQGSTKTSCTTVESGQITAGVCCTVQTGTGGLSQYGACDTCLSAGGTWCTRPAASATIGACVAQTTECDIPNSDFTTTLNSMQTCTQLMGDEDIEDRQTPACEEKCAEAARFDNTRLLDYTCSAISVPPNSAGVKYAIGYYGRPVCATDRERCLCKLVDPRTAANIGNEVLRGVQQGVNYFAQASAHPRETPPPANWVDPQREPDETVPFITDGKVCTTASRVTLSASIETEGIGSSRPPVYAAGTNIVLAGGATYTTRTFDGYNYTCRRSQPFGCRIDQDFFSTEYHPKECPANLPKQLDRKPASGTHRDWHVASVITSIVIVGAAIVATIVTHNPQFLISAATSVIQMGTTIPQCNGIAALAQVSLSSAGCIPGGRSGQNLPTRVGVDDPANMPANPLNPLPTVAAVGDNANIRELIPESQVAEQSNRITGQATGGNRITGMQTGTGGNCFAGMNAAQFQSFSSLASALAICIDSVDFEAVAEECYTACGFDYPVPPTGGSPTASPCRSGGYVLRGAVPTQYTASPAECGPLDGAEVTITTYGPTGASLSTATTQTDADGEFSYTYVTPAVDGRVTVVFATPVPGAGT